MFAPIARLELAELAESGRDTEAAELPDVAVETEVDVEALLMDQARRTVFQTQ